MSLSTVTHLAAAGAVALAVWIFQDARLGADLAEAKLDATTYQLDVRQAQRAADARVAQVGQQISSTYQGALNAAIPSKPVCRLLLIALAVSVTAYASNCPMPSSDLPTLPLPPSSSTPQPSTAYSVSAASDTQIWQRELMATQLMQQPAAWPGR